MPRGQSVPRLLMVLVFASTVDCDDRGGEVSAIRSALERLPGVRIIDVVGWDEIWPLFGPEAIRADLMVEETGRLVLCNLTMEAIKGNAPFSIARVGNWIPIVAAERDVGRTRYVAGCPTSVDVAPGSAFLELVPFALASPGDAVVNFERLSRLIESWPQRPSRIQARAGDYIDYWKAIYLEPGATTGQDPVVATRIQLAGLP